MPLLCEGSQVLSTSFWWCRYSIETGIQYIPRNMHTVFALLCFVVVIYWLIFPYPPGLLHWHCGNLTIAPVPAKQPWWISINTSCKFIIQCNNYAMRRPYLLENERDTQGPDLFNSIEKKIVEIRRSPYPHNGISYTSKILSLYWISMLDMIIWIQITVSSKQMQSNTLLWKQWSVRITFLCSTWSLLLSWMLIPSGHFTASINYCKKNKHFIATITQLRGLELLIAKTLYCICYIIWIDWHMMFGLEQEVGSLIAPMALAHPLHPIVNRSRNRSRNLWVGWCVSSWWLLFPSRSSVLIYIYIYIYALSIWVIL